MPFRRGSNRCFCGDGPGGGSEAAASAAGSLSVAAAQLRFVAVALASAGAVIGGAGDGTKNIAVAAVASSEIVTAEARTIGGGGGKEEERDTGEEPEFPVSAAVSKHEGDRPHHFFVAAGGCSGASVAAEAERATEASTDRGIVFPRNSSRGRHRGRQGQAEELDRWGAREIVELVEALWASGCLEACVHVLGETAGSVRFVCRVSGFLCFFFLFCFF